MKFLVIQRVTNLLPPIQDNDACTKSYVDQKIECKTNQLLSACA